MRELGDEESAVGELTAAYRTLVGLGAGPAAQAVGRLLSAKDPHGLTSREIEVLRLVASGMSNPQIAGLLAISEKTVARHRSNIFTKLGVSSRSAATAFAYEHRLVQTRPAGPHIAISPPEGPPAEKILRNRGTCAPGGDSSSVGRWSGDGRRLRP